MPDLKDIDFKDLKVSDIYSKFGLRSNPFPVTGIAAEDPGFAPFDEIITKELMAFIQDTYSRKFFGGFVIIGDYGFGKTYILKHLERRINESLSMRGEERACAIYVINPRSSADEFITSVLESFGIHTFVVMAWRLVTERLASEFSQRGEKFAEQFIPKNVQLNFFETQRASTTLLRQDLLSSPMKFIDEAYRFKANLPAIERFAQDTFLPIFKVPELAKGLAELTGYGETDSFKKWSEWLNYRNFRRALKKDIGEAEFFRAIMTVFRRNGYRHVYILVDEFEDIGQLGKRERAEYLSRLRDIIENNLESFSMVLCIKNDEWEKLNSAHPAFVERFSRGVELKNLSAERAKQVIAEYLSKVSDSSRTANEPIYPFTSEAVNEIVKKSAGVPRTILELCYVLLENSAREGKVIDVAMAKQVDSIRESLQYEKRRQMSL